MKYTDANQGTSDTAEEIMEATLRALRKHGYANLTMQAIADEFDKTKAVLHYHYDTKDELLVAFLDYLLDQFIRRLDVETVDDPDARLSALIDRLLLEFDDETSDEGSPGFPAALLEVRAHAPHNESYREQLTLNYELLKDMLTTIIDDGIEEGVFDSVDSEQMATLIMAAIMGGRAYYSTTNRDCVGEEVRDALEDQLLSELRTSDRT